MNRVNTVTLKIINDDTILDSFPKAASLTEAQKDLIKTIVKQTVEECLQQMKITNVQDANDRMLRLPEVMKMTGLSRSTIYNQMNKGNFPQSITLSERSVGWQSSQIHEWLSRRK